MALAGFRWIRAVLTTSTGSDANMKSAPSADVDAITDVVAGSGAQMQTPLARGTKAVLSARSASDVRLAGHDAAEVNGHRQVAVTLGRGLMGYIVRLVVFVKTTVMRRDSELESAPGETAGGKRTISVRLAHEADSAPSQNVGMDRTASTICDVEMSRAEGSATISEKVVKVDVAVGRTVATGVDADADSVVSAERTASIAFWFEPVLVNGVLRIKQVYHAEQKDIKLEVR